ncbi:unnamed protein product [Psylliodes chrysocephalus]|uniref:Uncharacterized protein n=1 Tax=Psylliodes chrysocephalus TaxID=3402493 RepID=A0A9P0GJ89_9CUCU|nr:unnamed protein product [Psylliodes chrysocephala]
MSQSFINFYLSVKNVSVKLIGNAIDQAEDSTSKTNFEEDPANEQETPGKMLDATTPITVLNRQENKLTNLGKKKNKLEEIILVSSFDTESEEEEEVVLNDEEETENDLDYENKCAGCKEDYRITKEKEDWIRCLICSRWLHEGCTCLSSMRKTQR